MIAVPAAAHSTFAPPEELCFASGAATYKVSARATAPDYRVRFDNAATRPDLRMELVDRPEIADFVLVDDIGPPQGNACRSPAPVRTIKIDDAARSADITVSFGRGDTLADYRIYVHSARYSHRDVAAVLAAMWKAHRSLELAERR